jgi:hypothetical protein
MDLYFTQYFGVDTDALDAYGALDISVVSDLPLFVDPFLLFNSANPTYQELHEDILRYLRFLRDNARPDLDPNLIDNWYRFKEVRQNWLGFTQFGNGGQGLGRDFAVALHGALGEIFPNFGEETVTRGSHLEKLCLIRPGVGRDNISDFTTNLIKGFLCSYTEDFAREYLAPEQCATFAVPRARFSYQTRTWATESYYLPRLADDFVLLTPMDILTRDETWINYSDLHRSFALLPEALPDAQQRAQVNQYFSQALGIDPTPQQQRAAVEATIRRFPELIDLYIRLKEDAGEHAVAASAAKVRETQDALIDEIRAVVEDLVGRTEFYDKPWTSYDECLERVRYFKAYIEDNDGYRLFNAKGKSYSNETDLQLAFGLVWGGSELDINREVNNGRGPVDFKASYGSGDKALIEFKLASNKKLKQNLARQVPIYEAANRTRKSVKSIVSYSEKDETPRETHPRGARSGGRRVDRADRCPK